MSSAVKPVKFSEGNVGELLGAWLEAKPDQQYFGPPGLLTWAEGQGVKIAASQRGGATRLAAAAMRKCATLEQVNTGNRTTTFQRRE